MSLKQGDSVTWISQSQGSWKEKRGTVISVVPAGASAIRMLEEKVGAVPKSRIKFQDVSKFERVLVEVKRGGKSGLLDYYAPKLKTLVNHSASEDGAPGADVGVER